MNEKVDLFIFEHFEHFEQKKNAASGSSQCQRSSQEGSRRCSAQQHQGRAKDGPSLPLVVVVSPHSDRENSPDTSDPRRTLIFKNHHQNCCHRHQHRPPLMKNQRHPHPIDRHDFSTEMKYVPCE